MVIKLPTDVFNEIDQALKSGSLTETMKYNVVSMFTYFNSVKAFKAAEWLGPNMKNWIIGLREGFEIDNSQEQQLEDIKT